MIQIILLRMWRERNLMLILFIGLCLVTGFLALGPLYVRAIAAAEFETQLDRSQKTTLRIDLSNSLPIDPAIHTIITDTLGERVQAARPYITSGGAVCGFQYNPEQPEQFGAPTTTTGCYLAYAYPEFDALFTLTDGRLPSAESSTGIIEAVITTSMQADTGWNIGHKLIYGEERDAAVMVEIVGIVEETLPQSDPFWADQHIFEEFTFFFTAIDSRQERSFIVSEEGYLEYMQAAQETTFFNWRIILERSTIRAGEINALQAALGELTAAVRDRFPSMEIFSTLDDLLRRFQENVAMTQPPITFLSVLVLVLMLFNMVTITALIQEQQLQEWAMFASRGGSRLQLLGMQFITIAILNLAAIILGPVLALGLLYVLTVVGPQASILDAHHIGGITPDAALLSLGAAGALQIALMLPAWNGARESLLRLKREAARPTRPLWERYGIDFVLILAGLILLVRLYGLATGANLGTLLRDPAHLIRTLAEGDIGLLLSDPFSLAAPALLLIGLTLLWVRIFPLLIGFVGRVVERRNDLLPRLALWNLERDPGHYSRMVLLLIGTLALGTASLVLSETRESGSWEQAQNQVGADTAVTIMPGAQAIAWDVIPGVEASTKVFLLVPESTNESLLIGISGDAPQEFPLVREVAGLVSVPEYDAGGQVLPENITALRLDVYAEAPEADNPPIATGLTLVLKDRTGRAYMVNMTTERPETSETFLTYRGEIPATAQPPLTLQEFQITSEQERASTLRHTIYLDNLRGVTPEGEENLLQRFEPDTYEYWDWLDRVQGVRSATLTTVDTRQTEGDTSLRVQYVLRRTGSVLTAPRLGYRDVRLAPIPVVLSPEMAFALGQRSRNREALRVGDTQTVDFDVLSPRLGLVKIELEISVVGIRDTFNAAGRDGNFLVADQDLLQQQINAGQGAGLGLYADTIWLDLPSREPQPETIHALEQLSGVSSITYAWDRYMVFLRAPLPNAISGVLFAGFWVSLLLSLMDFAFYLLVTIRQRQASFATLRALGWSQQRLPQLLLMEQVLFITPALVIGVLAGLLLAGLIVPFLALAGNQPLQIPLLDIGLIVTVLVLSFYAIIRAASTILRRMELTQVMRFGD